MRRALVAGVLLLSVLSGCGDPQEEYCAAVEKHRKEFAEMVSADAGAGALLQHLPMLRDLAGHAPPDLTDEWQALLTAVEDLDGALDDAGVRPEKFRSGRPPADLPKAQRSRIRNAASRLSSDTVVQAASGIEQQARDVCGVNIGL